MRKIPGHSIFNSRNCIIWPLLYMVGIFCLSSIPNQSTVNHGLNPATWMSPNFQNLLHFPLYSGLAWLWFWALHNRVTKTGYRYLLTLILTVGFGLLDEWHQSFVPGRHSSLTDAGLNLIGAITGAIACSIWLSADKGGRNDE